MIVGLIIAIVISTSAVTAAVVLLWRFRDWRFGFLAGLCFLAAAWVLMTQLSRLLTLVDELPVTLESYQSAYPMAVLSLLVLCSTFFLERIVDNRMKQQQSLKLAQVSLDRASIPAFWFTSEGNIRYVNDSAQRSLGVTPEGLLSKTIFDIAPQYSPADWAGDWQSVKKSGSANLEAYFRAKDGQLFPVDGDRVVSTMATFAAELRTVA